MVEAGILDYLLLFVRTVDVGTMKAASMLREFRAGELVRSTEFPCTLR